MVTPQLRRSWRFMHENAGYCTPPGRAACALDLARAELEAESRGWRFGTEPEQDAWTVTDEQRERIEAGETVYLVAFLGDEDGRVIGSLGGIEVASEHDPYLRVVAAELAAEALAEMAEAERIRSARLWAYDARA